MTDCGAVPLIVGAIAQGLLFNFKLIQRSFQPFHGEIVSVFTWPWLKLIECMRQIQNTAHDGSVVQVQVHHGHQVQDCDFSPKF